ncbi:SHO1 [Brettanomyces bruxellensis]|uniref:High osmolarity signaling protein SHO1 n=1 Tax=Dekkera bruxellensis TaxID=5007 RepID=A0A7D9CWS5_DEKBR|nr:SHO1 [Brettanomyces bruxellensis]
MVRLSTIRSTSLFGISTYLLAVAAWIVAFAGSIAAASDLNSYYPKFAWWGLVFQLLLLIFVIVLYLTSTFHRHRMFLNCFIAIAFVYNSNSTNNLIYYSWSSTAAASAGFILCCIINILWLFYFGSDPTSPLIELLDSVGDGENLVLQSRRLSARTTGNPASHNAATFNNGRNEVYSPGKDNQNPFEGEPYSRELNGFENPAQDDVSASEDGSSKRSSSDIAENTATGVSEHAKGKVASSNSHKSIIPDSDYPILVRGLYDYAANPDDINELSFKKGEIFKVKDTTGNWWQGKNSNGDIGMCPSNYLEVIS